MGRSSAFDNIIINKTFIRKIKKFLKTLLLIICNICCYWINLNSLNCRDLLIILPFPPEKTDI